jgi:hypothetical protein
MYHPSGEMALPCYPIKIVVRVLASSRIIELWFEAWNLYLSGRLAVKVRAKLRGSSL